VKDSSSGDQLQPNSKALGNFIVCEDKNFMKFIDGCLHWDPDLRLTPEEALRHEWILEGIPLKIQKSYKSIIGLDILDSDEMGNIDEAY
jgi:serine/threonine protein kinase